MHRTLFGQKGDVVSLEWFFFPQVDVLAQVNLGALPPLSVARVLFLPETVPQLGPLAERLSEIDLLGVTVYFFDA